MDEQKKSLWKTIAGNVLNVAGDLTPIGGDALKNIGKKLLKKDNATTDEIQSYLEEHPEAFQAYQTMLKEHERQMYDLENQRLKTESDEKVNALNVELQQKQSELASITGDLSNARASAIQLQTNKDVPYIQKITPSILSLVIVILTFAAFYFVFTKTFPTANRDMVMMVLGVLMSKFSDLIGFYFGSSDYLSHSGKIFEKKVEEK